LFWQEHAVIYFRPVFDPNILLHFDVDSTALEKCFNVPETYEEKRDVKAFFL